MCEGSKPMHFRAMVGNYIQPVFTLRQVIERARPAPCAFIGSLSAEGRVSREWVDGHTFQGVLRT